MRSWKLFAAALAACVALAGHAGEMAERKAIMDEVGQAFKKGDFKGIEARYAAALKGPQRTGSGAMVAQYIYEAGIPGPVGVTDTPNGRDDHWVPIEKKVEQWAKQSPDSALVAIVQSSVYSRHAWSWRGNGYASSVTKEGSAKYREYTNKAFEALMAREAAGRKDPYWYAQMISVAQDQGWPRDRFFAMVTEAATAFPAVYDIYFNAAYAMVPKWGGSTQLIAQFADWAVKNTHATEGESMYARVYWAVGNQLGADLAGPEVDWKRIRRGFDDVVKRYPVAWNMNNYARMACEARDAATAKRVLLKIGDDIDTDAWRDRAEYVRCKQFAGLPPSGAR